MEATSHESAMVWQFLRRHFVQIVMSAVLMAMVYLALVVWMPYQREQRIARKLEAQGGDIAFEYAGPIWIPQLVQDRLPCLDRICRVCQLGPTVPPELLSELGSLNHLQYLYLGNTQVTDDVLEHLGGLTRLTWLDLNSTQVTDAGMQHLTGLTSLEGLNVDNTRVTFECRATLRKALPNCTIDPEP